MIAFGGTFGSAHAQTMQEEGVGKELASSIVKFAKYKTPGREVSTAKVKFDNCKLTFTQITKFGTASHEVMGTTVTRTSDKRDVAIELGTVRAADISIGDHLFEGLKTIRLPRRLSEGTEPILFELVVREDGAALVRSAIIKAAGLCSTE
jgi:hypothetical protein